MGKQKSYILVGSVFAGFIILMLLVTLITRNVKETKVMFDSDIYYVELGKTRALTPTIYAGGDVLDGVTFQYESEDESIFTVAPGCYSVGTSSVKCWAFYKEGSSEISTTVTPYNKDDVVTVETDPETGNLYWYVNGEKTRASAEKKYTEKEIEAKKTTEYAYVECFYLNGESTNIPYDEDVIPERNEKTGTWFIKGKDTKVKYESIPSSIYGAKIGSSKITAIGVIDGEEYKLTATIQVCEPDPEGINISYLDKTLIVKANEAFKIDYEIYTNSSVNVPLQTVEYNHVSDVVRQDDMFVISKEGKYNISLSVPNASFRFNTPKTLLISVNVIVVDTTQEQIDLMEQARALISEIGTLTKLDEYKERFNAAKNIVDQLEESNYEKLPNKEKYKNSKETIEKFDNAVEVINNIGLLEDTPECKERFNTAKKVVEEFSKANQSKIPNIKVYQDAVKFFEDLESENE